MNTWDKMNRVKLSLGNGYILSIIQPSEKSGGVVETALLDPDGNFIPLDPKNCGTVTCPRIYPEDDVQQNLNSTDLVNIILKAKSYAERNYPFSTREASQNNERFGWSTQDHV